MIAIKDMDKIPMSCVECGLKSGGYCYHKKPPYNLSESEFLREKPKDCPLVEIVTCKDCTYDGCAKAHSPNHFCADGKRRE